MSQAERFPTLGSNHGQVLGNPSHRSPCSQKIQEVPMSRISVHWFQTHPLTFGSTVLKNIFAFEPSISQPG